MKRFSDTSRLLLILVLAEAGLRAQEIRVVEPKGTFDPRFYVCYKSPKPVVIDGKANDPGWKKAEWTEGFGDIEGGRNPSPRYRTRVKMLWDDEYFYIAAEIEEPAVWGTRRERDSVVFEDNDFEVFIDPDGDTHQYYELELNALNTVWDLLLIKPYRDGGPAVSGWDIKGLRTAVTVDGTLNEPKDKDKGWTAEIAIPWASLRECAPGKKEGPGPGDQWRVNFSRVEYRPSVQDGAYVKAMDPSSGRPYAEDNWSWSPQGLINAHYPEMWGFVQFSAKTAGKGRDLFADGFDEKVKWALRRIYYREREFRQDRGVFTADFSALGFGQDPSVKPDGWEFPPRISITESLFEALFRNADGASWHIRQDGLVWKEEPPVK
jgi:hypothetical protein